MTVAPHSFVGKRFFAAENVLFLGFSCIYPKLAAQPITEDALLTILPAPGRV